MSGPTRRAWSLWDGPKCLHTGSVVAPSDADGLRGLLAALPPGEPPLSPARHYRLRVGSAVASSAGDELQRTAESSSMPGDTAAEAAKEAREALEVEAKRLLERELAERLAGIVYDPATHTSRPAHSDELESLVDWVTLHPDERAKRAAPSFPSCSGTGGDHVVRELELAVTLLGDALRGIVHWTCDACRSIMTTTDSVIDNLISPLDQAAILADRLNVHLMDARAPGVLHTSHVHLARKLPGRSVTVPFYATGQGASGGGGGGVGGTGGGNWNASASIGQGGAGGSGWASGAAGWAGP